MTKTTRILIDNSGYELRNFGDIAMLVAAVNRFKQLYPNNDIRVFTEEPERLKLFIPDAKPVSLVGKSQWLMPWNFLGAIRRLLPPTLQAGMLKLENLIKLYFSNLSQGWISYRLGKRNHVLTPMHSYLEEVSQADIVVGTGGGYVTDSFAIHAINLLLTLGLAQALGKPTALLGQGLGPANSPRLLYWARRIMPRLSYISLREGKFSLPFAESIGVPYQNIKVTGDDAVIMAYSKKPGKIGNGIGINLRVADYSGVKVEEVETIRKALQTVADELASELVPIPITIHKGDSDLDSIHKLLGDSHFAQACSLETLDQVINQVGKCRVVITGSYHAGVFSLSQGISVIGIAASDYYRHKFEGLAGQFEVGCRIVDRDKPEFEANLRTAIQESWAGADAIRPKLLKKAKAQIDLAESGYRLFKQAVETNYGSSE